MNKEISRILIDKIGRETVDRFIEDEGGDLTRVETISLEAVAEEIADALIKQGYHTNDNSAIKTYSKGTLMKQTKAWLIDQIRLLEQSNRDYEWQVNNQDKNYMNMLSACASLSAQRDKRISELEMELSHRKEDLVHADEKVQQREYDVVLRENAIKQQAVREFVEKLKGYAYHYVYSYALYSEGKNKVKEVVDISIIDELVREVTGE